MTSRKAGEALCLWRGRVGEHAKQAAGNCGFCLVFIVIFSLLDRQPTLSMGGSWHERERVSTERDGNARSVWWCDWVWPTDARGWGVWAEAEPEAKAAAAAANSVSEQLCSGVSWTLPTLSFHESWSCKLLTPSRTRVTCLRLGILQWGTHIQIDERC